MAKKRKLPSSEPEVVQASKKPLQQEPPPQLETEEPEEETIPIQAEDQQTLEMAVDPKEDNSEDEENDDGDEEVEEVEEEGEEEEEEAHKQEGETLAAANSGAPMNPALGKALTAMLTSQGAAGPAADNLIGGLEDQMKQQNGGIIPVEEDDEPVEKLLEPCSREQLLALVKQAIEKHPDFSTNVRNLADADPALRKIFVHGLGWDTTAEILISEFSKYGEIEDCKAVTDRASGKSKGYAFILFKRRSGARAALKEPQKRIGSRLTSSQLASAGPVPAPPPTGSSSAAISSAAAASQHQASEYTQRKIFVSNVSSDVDPAKLLEFFQQFGEVEEGPLGLDRHTGKPKGFALFVYRRLESAKKALEEPHKTFEGLTLHCQKAIDGPKQSKGYMAGQGHHHHHQQAPQPQFHGRKEKSKYGAGPSGHLMAPSGPPPYNPAAVQPPMNPVLGQALTALLASQGAGGLGIGNLLGGLGPQMHQQGPPAPGGYGPPPTGGYVAQPGMQGGYQNPQMGQGGARPHHPGPGAPYMGH